MIGSVFTYLGFCSTDKWFFAVKDFISQYSAVAYKITGHDLDDYKRASHNCAIENADFPHLHPLDPTRIRN